MLDNILVICHNQLMRWIVKFYKAFDAEFDGFSEIVQDELLAHAKLLEQFGPTLSRPHADTLALAIQI